MLTLQPWLLVLLVGSGVTFVIAKFIGAIIDELGRAAFAESAPKVALVLPAMAIRVIFLRADSQTRDKLITEVRDVVEATFSESLTTSDRARAFVLTIKETLTIVAHAWEVRFSSLAVDASTDRSTLRLWPSALVRRFGLPNLRYSDVRRGVMASTLVGIILPVGLALTAAPAFAAGVYAMATWAVSVIAAAYLWLRISSAEQESKRQALALRRVLLVVRRILGRPWRGTSSDAVDSAIRETAPDSSLLSEIMAGLFFVLTEGGDGAISRQTRVAFFERREDELYLSAFCNSDFEPPQELVRGLTVAKGVGVAGLAWARGEPVIADVGEGWGRTNRIFDLNRSQERDRIRSIYCYPVFRCAPGHFEDLLGVISIDSAEPHGFDRILNELPILIQPLTQLLGYADIAGVSPVR